MCNNDFPVWKEMKCQFWYIVSLVVDMEWFVLNCDLTDSLYL